MGATTLKRENPFSSHRIQPGALPFFFADGKSAKCLADLLAENNWRGQIIGSHGSGKSTLLYSLLPHLQATGRDVVRGEFRGGQFAWVAGDAPLSPPSSRKGRILVIDGFERLSAFRRLFWNLRCWQRGDGLLVTAHRDMGLPMLYQTRVTPEVAQQVVRQLVTDDDGIVPCDVKRALKRHPGDLRSVLFALYDLHESRRHI